MEMTTPLEHSRLARAINMRACDTRTSELEDRADCGQNQDARCKNMKCVERKEASSVEAANKRMKVANPN